MDAEDDRLLAIRLTSLNNFPVYKIVKLFCFILLVIEGFFSLIVFIRSSPDIRWKCYKNTVNSRTKKENIEVYENRMLSVLKVGIEPTK